MYLIYKTKQVLKRNSQSKMTEVRPVKTWGKTENNKHQPKHHGENGSKESLLALHCGLSYEEPEIKSHNLLTNDFF